MKKLIFFLSLVFLLSCEKDEPQSEMPENECWECLIHYYYGHDNTGPVIELKSYCNRTDLGFKPAGEITEADINLYIKQHTDHLKDLQCYKVK
jgi:hypothetical protein